MAVVIYSNTALSTAAYTKTADLVSGTYQFVGKGKVTLIAKGSAVGTNCTCLVGGVALVSDQVIPYTGTAGTLSVNDNIICSQVMNGGRVELYIRNTTAGALTNDIMLLFEPQ
jgi:hypothetical protein